MIEINNKNNKREVEKNSIGNQDSQRKIKNTTEKIYKKEPITKIQSKKKNNCHSYCIFYRSCTNHFNSFNYRAFMLWLV